MKFFTLLTYWHKKYYAGAIVRWLVTDRNQIGVYCACCGNYANGVMRVNRWFTFFRLPLCKTHLAHFFYKDNPHLAEIDHKLMAPCEIEYGKHCIWPVEPPPTKETPQ